MQKITKPSQVIAGEWYWVGQKVLRTMKRGRWVYVKEPYWVEGETIQMILSRPRLFGPMYGPIPRPPKEG